MFWIPKSDIMQWMYIKCCANVATLLVESKSNCTRRWDWCVISQVFHWCLSTLAILWFLSLFCMCVCVVCIYTHICKYINIYKYINIFNLAGLKTICLFLWKSPRSFRYFLLFCFVCLPFSFILWHELVKAKYHTGVGFSKYRKY